MRVAELSRHSGVPVATIKYYLREGLLARGVSTGPNQADYGEGHLRRLRLIRALIDVGGLSVAASRGVLAAVDDDSDLDQRLGHVIGSVTRPAIKLDDADRASARARTDELVESAGWSNSHPDYPARRSLDEVVATLTRLGADAMLANLDRYADIASRVAEVDLDTLADLTDVDTVLEQALIATVLGDELLASLRRVAQASESGRRLASGATVVAGSAAGAGRVG